MRDEAALPIPYAHVMLKGTNNGTTTDEFGSFELFRVSPGSHTLVVSAVGYERMEQPVTVDASGNATVELIVKTSSTELTGVTISGQKRRISSVTKTLTPIENLPISVQLVEQELIQQQQIFDIRDAVKNVSGVTVTGSYNGGYAYFSSRGFNMNNWSNFRRNGMFIWNMGNHFNDNIERVEILKGPSSILFGDVAPGGIMNFVTKKPLNYDYGRVELRLGEYGLFRPTFDLSGPLNEKGNVLYRMNATYESSESFRDVVESEALMFAPAITWNINSKLSWNVEATYKLDNRIGDPGLISPDGTFEGLRELPISTFLGEPRAPYQFSDKSLFSTLNYYLNDNWLVRNTTYYTRTDRVANNIYLDAVRMDDNGLIPRSQYAFSQYFEGWGSTVDFVGQFTAGSVRHEVVVGAEINNNRSRFTDGISTVLRNDIDPFEPVYNQSLLYVDTTAWAGSRFFYERMGVYAQDQVSLFEDRLHIMAGLRLNVSTTGNLYDNPETAPENDEPTRDTPLSPRFGILYKPLKQLSVYGSYTNSYEQNGPDWINPSVSIGPTPAQQVEVGTKLSLLQDKLGITLAAFDIVKEDIYGWIDTEAAPDFDYISFSEAEAYATYQGGEHRSRGLELDVNGQLAEGLTVVATAAYIEATIVEDPAYASGNELGGTPRYSSSLWAHYTLPITSKVKFNVGYGAFYRSGFFLDPFNDPAGEVEPFWSMDASAGLEYDGLSLRVNVTNFTNNEGYLASYGVYEPLWTRRTLLSLAYTF